MTFRTFLQLSDTENRSSSNTEKYKTLQSSFIYSLFFEIFYDLCPMNDIMNNISNAIAKTTIWEWLAIVSSLLYVILVSYKILAAWLFAALSSVLYVYLCYVLANECCRQGTLGYTVDIYLALCSHLNSFDFFLDLI